MIEVALPVTAELREILAQLHQPPGTAKFGDSRCRPVQLFRGDVRCGSFDPVGNAGDVFGIVVGERLLQLGQFGGETVLEFGQDALHQVHVSHATVKQLVEVKHVRRGGCESSLLKGRAAGCAVQFHVVTRSCFPPRWFLLSS